MNGERTIIGRAETVRFPELVDLEKAHARIDSGARTSAIWGDAKVNQDGTLEVTFFGKTEKVYTFTEFERQAVATSTGQIDKRYKIRLLVVLKSRKIRASFTIADRSTQVYPVLIGRNVLRGKFLVDVKVGNALKKNERMRINDLQASLEEDII